MECDIFRKHLEDFAEGKIDAELHQRCESHMTSCVHCLDLWMMKNSDGAERNEASTEQILQSTSTDACEQCENQLDSYIQDALSGFDAKLIKRHLEYCEPCSQLEYELKQLVHDLESMRYMQPPKDQVEAILARTLTPYQRLGRKTALLKSKIKTLYLRPRFSLEASMSASLAWFLLVGAPFSTAINAEDLPSIGRIIETEALETQQSLAQASSNLNKRFKSLQPLMLEGFNSIETGGADLIHKSWTVVEAQAGEVFGRVNDQLFLQNQNEIEQETQK